MAKCTKGDCAALLPLYCWFDTRERICNANQSVEFSLQEYTKQIHNFISGCCAVGRTPFGSVKTMVQARLNSERLALYYLHSKSNLRKI